MANLKLAIDDPVIVATNGVASVFVNSKDAPNIAPDSMVTAQLYETEGNTFSPTLPFASFGRFVYALEMVPPKPFVKPQ